LAAPQYFFRMAELVAAGGAVRHTGNYDGPDWAEKPTCFADGSNLHYASFPWELTNTDYFRRVLAQVGYALQPLVEDQVKQRNVVVHTAGNRPAGNVVFQSQDPNGDIGVDAYYLMKHILFSRQGKTPTCHTTFYVDQMKAAGVKLKVDDLKTKRKN
jgi:hypothetical protein